MAKAKLKIPVEQVYIPKFASLFYANWFMYLLVVGTMGFFVVHTTVWVSKELYHVFTDKERKSEDE